VVLRGIVDSRDANTAPMLRYLIRMPANCANVV
jgi:hypothetical protein